MKMQHNFKNFFLIESNMLIAIALSAIVITLSYFPRFSENFYVHSLDQVFIIFFTIEAIVKIRHYGWKNYIESHWNKFDFLIVLVSFPSLLEFLNFLPDASYLLILRLFRLFRLLRAIHVIPNLENTIKGVGRAIQSALFVLLVLLGFNFIISILCCHFYAKVAPEFFADPLISIYSIFQIFTLEGWNEIPSEIALRLPDATLAGLSRFYFAIIVLLGGIFGLSLANAIFVDAMTEDNNDQLEMQITELKSEILDIKEMLRKAVEEK